MKTQRTKVIDKLERLFYKENLYQFRLVKLPNIIGKLIRMMLAVLITLNTAKIKQNYLTFLVKNFNLIEITDNLSMLKILLISSKRPLLSEMINLFEKMLKTANILLRLKKKGDFKLFNRSLLYLKQILVKINILFLSVQRRIFRL